LNSDYSDRLLGAVRPCRPRVRACSSDPINEPVVLKIVPWAFGRHRACGLRNRTAPIQLSRRWRTSYGRYRLWRAARTCCINRFAWASALPQMPSPCDRPEHCPNSRRVRVPDTQMHDLRPRLRCSNPRRSSEVECSGLGRHRASAAEVRPESSEGKQSLFWSPNGHDLCIFSEQTPRAHGPISETTMPTANLNALTILGAFDAARSELVGKAVVLTDGKAGTLDGVWLDELHGLRISIRGHDGKWPVSTIKLVQP
jgi:hypothetical protein